MYVYVHIYVYVGGPTTENKANSTKSLFFPQKIELPLPFGKSSV